MSKFLLDFEVRDYECDLQGIVNNAVYQNYYEHARHQHLRSVGLDFAQLHQQNIDPVVYRIEIDFRKPLKSGNTFLVETDIVRDGNLKFIFNQEIKSNGILINKAKVTVVFTNKGKPIPAPADILEALGL
ncbi:thioesterase superfamily protein [Pseudopedobacter saltans DSM 12145]|uniref:Thioesterase superfamily protein n=1 Tax=Pseudopedobacter saltans (strain ATCC 51119 / DSM 12145 / JCM 21818 / CCUG 39354 / LMG 10337 / NBRC 100064 / NCIMB 13643) TaxID=762903 RepID=F0S592_PSESL|nr:thioesterase family protein [Pseudopedobacter saltans]ADY52037.1 thioesterase superfamily protein [Pseudopedobacter saltans DSM 12145]